MAKPVYKFGPFSVNPQARLLFRGGERVSLPPKAADLLVVLLEHNGELVTKEELLNRFGLTHLSRRAVFPSTSSCSVRLLATANMELHTLTRCRNVGTGSS